jgi:DNA-binding SARP family transcriptional activator
VEVRVLGPLEVRQDDEQLALGGLKQRALLAILALHANEVVSTDRLIDELWGAETPQTAAKSLQVHVSQLRKVLEPDRKSGESGQLLLTQPPGYRLSLGPDQLDAQRFKRLYDEGREVLANGDAEAAAAKLSEALTLWRGAPLADLTYASFAQSEISRLEEMRLAALEDRIEAEIECGRHTAVVGDLERLISSEPLRERPRRQLMLALYRSGRQAEALEVYREAHRSLVDELGIEPGRELKKLQAAILRQDPELDLRPAGEQPSPVAAAAESIAAEAPSESFVGRESELAEFQAAFDEALAGRMSLFLIAGEPGIGKSRLADEATSLAEARGARVCWGRCWEAGGAPAYWPWVQALREYIRMADDGRVREQLELGAADIAQMLPELHELFPDLPPPPSLDPEGARFRLFDSTGSFLRAAGESGPLVVVLDDLHAADEPSLLFLQFLARSLREARVVVVAAYRDTEPRREALNEAIAEARREPITRHIRLGGLDEAEVAAVVELIGGTQPSDELAAAIHGETEGNPLFVGELVRLLASEGRLEEAAAGKGGLSIPQGVREVIDHRLRRLSDDCKRLLSVASVLGREFRLDALERVAESPREQLLDLLDEAQAARVIVDLPGGRSGLRFSHALIRDSLYGDLGASERLGLHRRAVESLEELYGADRGPHLAELAYHSLEAAPGGEVEKAIEYARAAGDQAAALLAYEEAARLYELGIRALRSVGHSDEGSRCELTLALGDSRLRAGDEEDAKASFLQAAEIARTLGDTGSLARAALGYGGLVVWLAARGDRHLIPLLDEALEALPETDSALRARLMARLSCAIRDQPDRDRRRRLCEQAVEMARRIGDQRTLGYTLDALCIALVDPDAMERFDETAHEVVAIAEELGEPERAFTGNLYLVCSRLQRRDIDGAKRAQRALTRHGEGLRIPAYRWGAAEVEAALALFEGRFDAAEELIGLGYEAGQDAIRFNALAAYLLQRFLLHRERGGIERCERGLRELAAKTPEYHILRSALASLYVEVGDLDEAARIFAELARNDFEQIYYDEEFLASMTLLAEVCTALGDRERAAWMYESLLPHRDRNAFGMIEIVLGAVERPLGLLATLMSRWEKAEPHFERGLELNASMGTAPWTAHTQHDYARMLIRRGGQGNGTRAAELLRAAMSCYEELGMTSWQERAAADLDRIGSSARR